jgi:hypothetical protein
MSDKYRIINCPAYIHRPLSTHDRVCLLGDKVKPNHKELYVYCQDCTDCVLKQIVELAKGYKEELIDRKTKKVVATRYFKLTKEILELLDIQEVE